MNNEEDKPEGILGYLELEDKRKPIKPMNDVFINYTFDKKENWETLRVLTNILYDQYNQEHDIPIELLEGEIVVTTQYPRFKELATKAKKGFIKYQDSRIDADNKVDYVEFQNEPYPKLPIAARSMGYFGFSISKGEKDEKPSTNVWLINGTVEALLCNKVFANFSMVDLSDGRQHPNKSSILYVDLKILSKSNTKAGELAAVLLGKIETPKDKEVKLIADTLNLNFEEFKKDMGVRTVTTIFEELEYRGEARGEARGIEKARAEYEPLLEEYKQKLEVVLAQLKAQESGDKLTSKANGIDIESTIERLKGASSEKKAAHKKSHNSER